MIHDAIAASAPTPLDEIRIAELWSWVYRISKTHGGSVLDTVERLFILRALIETDWSQKDAASLLGISNRVMNYKVGKYGITHKRWYRNNKNEKTKTTATKGHVE